MMCPGHVNAKMIQAQTLRLRPEKKNELFRLTGLIIQILSDPAKDSNQNTAECKKTLKSVQNKVAAGQRLKRQSYDWDGLTMCALDRAFLVFLAGRVQISF